MNLRYVIGYRDGDLVGAGLDGKLLGRLVVPGSEAGSYLRLIDLCITQL